MSVSMAIKGKEALSITQDGEVIFLVIHLDYVQAPEKFQIRLSAKLLVTCDYMMQVFVCCSEMTDDKQFPADCTEIITLSYHLWRH